MSIVVAANLGYGLEKCGVCSRAIVIETTWGSILITFERFSLNITIIGTYLARLSKN